MQDLFASYVCCRQCNVTQRSKMISKEQGPVSWKAPKPFRTRKAIRRIPTLLFSEAGLSMCCKGNESFKEKSSSRQREFCTSNSSRHLRKVCHPHTALLRFVTRLFSLKPEKKKKKKVKNAKLVVFNLKWQITCAGRPGPKQSTRPLAHKTWTRLRSRSRI